jgi:TolA-binding protein
MTKKVQNQEEVIVAEAVSKTEKFFEQNGKKVITILAALIIVIAGVVGYKFLVVDKNEKAAAELITYAQENIKGETPNYELALNGDEKGAGFLDVIEQYGSTKVGNIANHYAGVCYLHLGDLENAIKYLEAYDAVGGSVVAEIIDAQNIGLQGDIAVEKGDYEEAAKLFGKAVKTSENEYTTPHYLYKQALALKAAGKIEEAKACCQTLIEKYPNAMEKNAAEKLL